MKPLNKLIASGSSTIVNRLSQLLSGLTHVRDVGLKQANDIAIFKWEKAHGFGVITTDSDFVALARRPCILRIF